jgi:hypothetical protein
LWQTRVVTRGAATLSRADDAVVQLGAEGGGPRWGRTISALRCSPSTRAVSCGQLDVTVAGLTFEQLRTVAAYDAHRGAREQARTRVLYGLDSGVAGRLASRWVWWADTFGLPYAAAGGPPREQLAHPYRPASTRQDQDYADALLPIYDAALGILGAPLTPEGEADHEALSAPWRQVCLPSGLTASTAYGPHT